LTARRGRATITRVRRVLCLGLVITALFASAASSAPQGGPTYWVDHVIDGDTVRLSNGQKVRLVQIDTPEVYSGTECYGRQASTITTRLLPPGTRVVLVPEPATDNIDEYGRLLRYVVRARDDRNVNLRLVALGAAAPYFYEFRRGRYANRLEALAKHARAKHLGLWGACPHTPHDPYHGVETRR
jgi:endonuclease YncB( thermonuclease family)